MGAIRSILLVLLTVVLVAFIAINWTKVPVNFWPLDNGEYLNFEWPVGFIVLISFMAGVVPMWLLHQKSIKALPGPQSQPCTVPSACKTLMLEMPPMFMLATH